MRYDQGKNVTEGSEELPYIEDEALPLFTSVQNGLLRLLPDALRGVEDEEITYYTPERRPILTVIPDGSGLRLLLPRTRDTYPDVGGLEESHRRFGSWLEYVYDDAGSEIPMLLLVATAIINAR